MNGKQNVTSRVLTRKNAPPRGGHVFPPTGIIFAFVQDIIGMNLLTEFNENRTINVKTREKCSAPWQPCFSSKNWKINVASRVLTRKNAQPPGGHVFQQNSILFLLVQYIIGMNLLPIISL
ncbi:hypothetical protein DPMN_089483 [Dreissena polymorpha]|uniref:Uncharacterized protein n=1 Tax=Dreissena polymorpha TaxID=45954 RepID=A0A9D4KYD8_DREPO|nr:hypothetical protein DPMN_089483 [Dreissena polymorpha]